METFKESKSLYWRHLRPLVQFGDLLRVIVKGSQLATLIGRDCDTHLRAGRYNFLFDSFAESSWEGCVRWVQEYTPCSRACKCSQPLCNPYGRPVCANAFGKFANVKSGGRKSVTENLSWHCHAHALGCALVQPFPAITCVRARHVQKYSHCHDDTAILIPWLPCVPWLFGSLASWLFCVPWLFWLPCVPWLLWLSCVPWLRWLPCFPWVPCFFLASGIVLDFEFLVKHRLELFQSCISSRDRR